jgi:hypothetical protein
VWVSRADIVAYYKIGTVDAQALIDSASRRCVIDGVEEIRNTSSKRHPTLI